MVVSPDTFPFMVIGNKSDLEDKRTVSADQAKRVINDLGLECEHAETSAKDSSNIESAFKALAEKPVYIDIGNPKRDWSGSQDVHAVPGIQGYCERWSGATVVKG